MSNGKTSFSQNRGESGSVSVFPFGLWESLETGQPICRWAQVDSINGWTEEKMIKGIGMTVVAPPKLLIADSYGSTYAPLGGYYVYMYDNFQKVSFI